MNVEIVQEKLASYGCTSGIEEEQALREITQEIILAGLGRTDFFEHAGFHGGTCLRIFHGLNRFSEDLDFALREPDESFELSPYLDRIRTELLAFGYALETEDRSSAGQAVQKAFVKDDSIGKLLRLSYRPRTGPLRKLRVKLEVVTRPPQGATYAMPVLDYPFPAAVRVFDLPSLFAGKIHALLCRHYLKGRDWYDFIWYTARRTAINSALLSSALDQQGPWAGTRPRADKAWCVAHLSAVIQSLDWGRARADVQRFLNVRELPSLTLWTPEFFLTQCRKLEATDPGEESEQ
jgi:predicted nucleotidyltransferase component of viral defense system